MPNIDGEYRGREPICGKEWVRQHLYDHTQAEIDSLSIVVGIDGRNLPPLTAKTKRGTIKTIVKGKK